MVRIHSDRLRERVVRDHDQLGAPVLRPHRHGVLIRCRQPALGPGRAGEGGGGRPALYRDPRLDRQTLVKAGVRLGGLLNKALGDCGRQATQSASSSHRHDPAPCGVGMAAGR
jgi:hypothetical protein